ncbi:MAG TPA: transglutaminase-like domain-containing protein [Alphaproteobacteria bacterium]|nr:transglutaminase-like domain-containing protein [Alphaproteobacteria bacterium]
MDAVRMALITLEQVGSLPDAAIDLAETALALAALDYPQADYARYRAHLAALAQEVGARRTAPADALRDVLIDTFGYQGDRESYDDLDNANLIRVIDRRRGLPVALSILWLHAARAQGWRADGLNFPGHFLIRVADSERAVVIDPFNGGAVLGEAELAALRRRIGGADAALRPEHCAPVSNRAILLRLQNNIKLRLLQAKHIEAALTVLERMVLTAPQEPALWHECAGLHESLGNLRTATSCLERVIALASGAAARQAAAELAKLRLRLN